MDTTGSGHDAVDDRAMKVPSGAVPLVQLLPVDLGRYDSGASAMRELAMPTEPSWTTPTLRCSLLQLFRVEYMGHAFL